MIRCALFLAGAILLAGCSGGPLKERPVFEPPPKVEPPKPPSPPPAEPFGAWTSVSLGGPHAGHFRRLDFIFNRDGTYVAVAEASGEAQAQAGTFEIHEAVLALESSDGRAREWSWAREGSRLKLVEDENEAVLDPVR